MTSTTEATPIILEDPNEKPTPNSAPGQNKRFEKWLTSSGLDVTITEEGPGDAPNNPPQGHGYFLGYRYFLDPLAGSTLYPGDPLSVKIVKGWFAIDIR